jgi:hypothetical protein
MKVVMKKGIQWRREMEKKGRSKVEVEHERLKRRILKVVSKINFPSLECVCE